MEYFVEMNVGGDIFGSSTIHETLKKNIVEREFDIRELKMKILEKK